MATWVSGGAYALVGGEGVDHLVGGQEVAQDGLNFGSALVLLEQQPGAAVEGRALAAEAEQPRTAHGLLFAGGLGDGDGGSELAALRSFPWRVSHLLNLLKLIPPLACSLGALPIPLFSTFISN